MKTERDLSHHAILAVMAVCLVSAAGNTALAVNFIKAEDANGNVYTADEYSDNWFLWSGPANWR